MTSFPPLSRYGRARRALRGGRRAAGGGDSRAHERTRAATLSGPLRPGTSSSGRCPSTSPHPPQPGTAPDEVAHRYLQLGRTQAPDDVPAAASRLGAPSLSPSAPGAAAAATATLRSVPLRSVPLSSVPLRSAPLQPPALGLPGRGGGALAPPASRAPAPVAAAQRARTRPGGRGGSGGRGRVPVAGARHSRCASRVPAAERGGLRPRHAPPIHSKTSGTLLMLQEAS